MSPPKREVVIKIKMSAEARNQMLAPAKSRKGIGGRPRLDDGDETVMLRVKLPLDLKNELQETCETLGLVMSEVVRELIEAWLTDK